MSGKCEQESIAAWKSEGAGYDLKPAERRVAFTFRVEVIFILCMQT